VRFAGQRRVCAARADSIESLSNSRTRHLATPLRPDQELNVSYPRETSSGLDGERTCAICPSRVWIAARRR
jgi:hypothetical protein